MPSNLLWLLPTIYNTFKPFVIAKLSPFVVITYCLQQHYIPYRLKISCLPLYYYLPMVCTILWQKVFPIPNIIIESGNIEKNEKLI